MSKCHIVGNHMLRLNILSMQQFSLKTEYGVGGLATEGTTNNYIKANSM